MPRISPQIHHNANQEESLRRICYAHSIILLVRFATIFDANHHFVWCDSELPSDITSLWSRGFLDDFR